jgi:transposase-like protein
MIILIGIDMNGRKECLGIWILPTESASRWSDLIFAVDGLTGLDQAIRTAFPNSEIQRCIVHQIRNSIKFVSYKHIKALVEDLKEIYKATTLDAAESALDAFSETWDKNYPQISKSWRMHWSELSTYFKYSPEIRRLIYTTNPIENFNRKLKKVTKNRSSFPSEKSLFKLLYLAVMDISKKWDKTVKDWTSIFPQLLIYFEERMKPYYNIK